MLGGARVALPEAAPPPARRQGEELANRPGRRGAPGKGGTGRPLTREDTVASSNGRRPTRAQGGDREGGGPGRAVSTSANKPRQTGKCLTSNNSSLFERSGILLGPQSGRGRNGRDTIQHDGDVVWIGLNNAQHDGDKV